MEDHMQYEENKKDMFKVAAEIRRKHFLREAATYGPELPPEMSAKLKEDSKEVLKNEDLPCLLWDEMVDDPDNPDMAAMQALLYDEMDAKERAASFKHRGNDCMKHKSNLYYVRNAAVYYSKALAEGCGDNELESVCYGNRAQANLVLGNYRNAFNDSKSALELNTENIKCYFRGAKAAVELKEFSEAIALCQQGLKRDATNKDLKDILAKAQAGEKKAWADAKKIKAAKIEANKLCEAIKLRGLRLGADIYNYGGQKPVLDEDNMLHWRVSFLYPESMQCDVVEDMHEGATLDEMVEMMFGSDAPIMMWDPDHNYTADRVELYFQKNATTAYDEDSLLQHMQRGTAADEGVPDDEQGDRVQQAAASAAPVWVKVDPSLPLVDAMLLEGFVVPCQPVFHVVARGTDFYTRFKEGRWSAP